jgi:N-acetylglucosaminyl-diphospho-decaprenol L-rhamnosyltransferase
VVEVSVIVVNYNAGAHLARCLAALGAQTRADFEAIVVDNASSDGSFADARARIHDPRFVFEVNATNLGFAEANNRAAARARGPWLALLNPDAFPEPDWLERLIEATRRHPQTAIFGSTQLRDADPATLDGGGDRCLAGFLPWRGGFGAPAACLPADDYPVLSACAAAMFVRGDLFAELGGFEASYFAYCEDVDFCLRARGAGAEIMQARRAIVRHVGGGTTARRSAVALRLGARNALRTFARNLPRGAVVAILPVALSVWLLLAARAGGQAPAVLGGIGEALLALPEDWRRKRPAEPILRALDWNAMAALRRAGPRL